MCERDLCACVYVSMHRRPWGQPLDGVAVALSYGMGVLGAARVPESSQSSHLLRHLSSLIFFSSLKLILFSEKFIHAHDIFWLHSYSLLSVCRSVCSTPALWTSSPTYTLQWVPLPESDFWVSFVICLQSGLFSVLRNSQCSLCNWISLLLDPGPERRSSNNTVTWSSNRENIPHLLSMTLQSWRQKSKFRSKGVSINFCSSSSLSLEWEGYISASSDWF